MGGSSSRRSSSSWNFNPEEVRQQMHQELQKLRTDLDNQEFDVEVAEILSSALSTINARDAEATRRILDAIKVVLEKETEGSVDLLFGGSVAKHTYVDGLSDIDTLVILNKTELSDKTPAEVRAYFIARLRERFQNASIVEGRLAVTITIEQTEIQLLPALRNPKGVHVPNNKGDGWSRINPEAFTSALTRLNQETGGKVLPVIKLAKSIASSLPSDQQLGGYHMEALAIKTFTDYNGPRTTKSMLTEFFTKAPGYLMTPITDSTGQSKYVDEYLGAKFSPDRQITADAFQRIAVAMQNADRDRSVDKWKEILGQ
jgi:predicted nucleotidyltransferase